MSNGFLAHLSNTFLVSHQCPYPIYNSKRPARHNSIQDHRSGNRENLTANTKNLALLLIFNRRCSNRVGKAGNRNKCTGTAPFGKQWINSGTYTSNYSPLLAWGLMIFAVRDIECDFIVSVYFKTFIVLGILIPLMAVTGLISNTVMDTVGITGKRYAYGFTHPNVLGAVLLVIVICWCYLHWKSIKLYHIVIINLLSYGMMQITDSSSSFICIAFISVIALLERWFDKKSKLNVWYFGIIVLLIFCPAISYYFMVKYTPSNPLMLAIDLFTTGRLRTMNAFFVKYGVKILGNPIIFDMERRSLLLFALDNSYGYILIRFGIIVSLFYFMGLFKVIKRAIQIRDTRIIICVLTFLVYGLFENYFFKIQFNFTLLFIFTNYYGNSNKLRVKKGRVVNHEDWSNYISWCR